MQWGFIESLEYDSGITEGKESEEKQVWSQSDGEGNQIIPVTDDKAFNQRERQRLGKLQNLNQCIMESFTDHNCCFP